MAQSAIGSVLIIIACIVGALFALAVFTPLLGTQHAACP